MADMVELAPKAAQNIWSNGGDCKKLYIPKLKEIAFWFLYMEATGKKSTTVKKVSDIIKEITDYLEATNEATLAIHIKDVNLQVNM